MRTGSAPLWDLAGALAVVPSPPDPVLAGLLSAWWSTGRTFGCVSAKAGPWFVVPPDPSIWCAECAGERFATERRCCYCSRPVRVSKALTLAYEMTGDVSVLARGHRHCAEKARSQR
jgi:hypothetical protein